MRWELKMILVFGGFGVESGWDGGGVGIRVWLLPFQPRFRRVFTASTMRTAEMRSCGRNSYREDITIASKSEGFSPLSLCDDPHFISGVR